MTSEHGAATVAAPSHLGFCRCVRNATSAALLDGTPSKIGLDGAATVAAPCHLGFRRNALHYCLGPPLRPSTGRGREAASERGGATVAPPSHLGFCRNLVNQVLDAPGGLLRTTFYTAPRFTRTQSPHPQSGRTTLSPWTAARSERALSRSRRAPPRATPPGHSRMP